MNKTKKGKLKKIAVFCVAVMLALVSVFATLATQKEEIRASAEETTTTEERTIYPTDNLFDESLVTSSDIAHGSIIEIGGNYFIFQGNVSSTPGDSSYSNGWFRPFYSLYPSTSLYLRSGNIITISADYTVLEDSSFSGNFTSLFIYLYGAFELASYSSFLPSVGVKTRFSVSYTIPDGKDGFYYPVFTLNSLKIRIENIMINFGEVAYPYRPCNKSFYDQGYMQGKADGKEEGYTEGYQDASDTLNLGVLKGSKISASLTYSDNTKATITNEDPTFTYNGIDFRPSRDKWEASKMLENALVTVNFADSFSYKAFPLRFQGSSDVMSGTFLSTDGKKYSFNIERTDLLEGVVPGQFVISGSYPDNLQIKSVTIQFGRATDTLEGVLLSVSGQYQNGYANGYNDGFADNDSYSKGYVAGRDFGYNNGYNAGLAEGSAENGFAGLLFAVIDTPVKAFSSLLNFEILGVNMKSFVLSVLTLALFVVVVRWLLGKA